MAYNFSHVSVVFSIYIYIFFLLCSLCFSLLSLNLLLTLILFLHADSVKLLTFWACNMRLMTEFIMVITLVGREPSKHGALLGNLSRHTDNFIKLYISNFLTFISCSSCQSASLQLLLPKKNNKIKSTSEVFMLNN